MRLTIGKKLALAFGAITFVLLGLVGLSLRTGAGASDGIALVGERVDDTKLAAATAQSVLLARATVKEFLITGDEAVVREWESGRAGVLDLLDQGERAFRGGEREQLIGEVRAAFDRFDEAFTEVMDLTDRRDAAVAGMDAIGPAVSDRSRDVRAALMGDTDASLSEASAKTAELVLRARIEALRFLRTGKQDDYQRFRGFLDQARETANRLAERTQDATQRAAVSEIAAELGRYGDHAEEAFTLVTARRAISNDRIDTAGDEIVRTTDQLFESLKKESLATRDAVTADLASARTLTVTAAVVAVLLAATLGLLVVRGITRPIRLFLERFDLIARGDFTQRVECRTNDEIADLGHGFNRLVDEIAGLISNVQDTANQVAAAATEVAASSEQMASSTEHQRAQLTQVAAAIEEMAATVTEVSGRTGEVSRQSGDAGNLAAEGGQIVRRTVEEMGQIAAQVENTAAAVGQLSVKAEQIGEILTVINDIADQTNLLALNAAIEAARAGEHGRGFAVVADEVRKLAERTQEATQEVSNSIGEIQNSTGEATAMMGASKQRVSGGVELAQQAGDSLESIVNGSKAVAQSIDSIAAAVEEQSATSAEIARSIEVISAAADETTQGAGQAASAATQLSGNAESLRELVSRFKI